MEPIDLTKPSDGSAAPVDVGRSGAFIIPKQESVQAQPTTTETPAVDVNATVANQTIEMQPVPQQPAPIVESAPVRQPNVTETSDHPLPQGTSYDELQAKLAASQEQTKQVLLPQQQVTEAPKTGIADRVKGWFNFGKK